MLVTNKLKNAFVFPMKFLKHKKPIVPLPYSYYFVPVIIITLIGFFDSIYLAVSHYRNYVDLSYQSFCAVSRTLNCDTVSQSPYSIFLNVPVPIWGIVGYGGFLFLLVFALHEGAVKKRIWTMLFITSLIFSVYSLILAFMSSYYIRSYCIMCILSYLVNLALLFYTWIIRKRFECEPLFNALKLDFFYLWSFRKITVPGILAFSGISLVMIFMFPQYWHMNPPTFSMDMPSGFTENGHPWIGAEQPELEIIEFSDYRCFQCKKMHYFLRRIIETHPDKIRLIHRQFPMDHTINPLVNEPFHVGAARLAIVSLFAAEKEKFWEMNDLLFAIPREKDAINLRYFANQTGLEAEEMRHAFRAPELWLKLQKDIADGLKFGLTGTPGFIIAGQLHLAQIPSALLEPYR